jgi:hypothetical protein
MCHEYRYDGGLRDSKQKGKQEKTGFYTRLEWPEFGGVMRQYRVIVDIFRTIKDELTKISMG